jgi:hypothetical protein
MMSQISNPADRVKIKKMLGEVSNSMTRIEGERDLIKETIKEMSQEFNLSKRQLNRMAKVYHKQNFTREQEEHSEFEDLYTSIVESNT